jgi:enoyl-CoA hydratase/carnithine racemase
MIERFLHGPVHELRMARPPVNALDTQLLLTLAESVEAAPGDGADAIVLSGRPGMFSAGLDVPTLIELEPEDLEQALICLFEAMERLAASPVPVAAAITGHSPAGGAVLALFCDRRVMAAGEFGIGLTEVQVGIPLPTSIARVAALVAGHRAAEEMCSAGRLMSPEQALAAGFVHQVVAPEQVIPSAVEWCEAMLALPRHAMVRTRSIFRTAVLDVLREHRASDVAQFRAEWFRPETQRELRRLVEKLRKK